MRVLALATLLTILLPGQVGRGADAAFTEDILRFGEHWNRFHRRYFGCSASARTLDECEGWTRATFDYKEFLASRREAKRLFGLSEECK